VVALVMGHLPAERWFHTLVVLGAGLAGCGGSAVDEGGPAASDSGAARSDSGTDAPSSSRDCAAAAQFVCQDYATLAGCRCDPNAPLDQSACNSPFDFVCDEGPCEPPSPQSGTALCFSPSVGCRCDPQAPRPADCAAPEQFFCNEIADRYLDCACQPERAAQPASCPSEYCCQSSSPRFGCSCECAMIR